VSKKVIYLVIVTCVILGLVISLFFPMGIVLVAIAVPCFCLALFLVFKTIRRRKCYANIRNNIQFLKLL